MALPKKKTSKERKRKRRSHQALSLPPVDYCPQCRSPKLAHHVCLSCGTYLGREVVEVKSKKKE